jgi:hypothetical protein
MRHRAHKLLAVLAGLIIATAGLTTPASAQVNSGWDRCPADFSCYFSAVDGNGSIWTPPSCGWWDLPYRVVSVWNRGHGTIYWYVGSSYTGWSSPVGYRGSNGALAADRIDIAC